MIRGLRLYFRVRMRPEGQIIRAFVCLLPCGPVARAAPAPATQPTTAPTPVFVQPEQRAGDEAFQRFVDRVEALRLADRRTSVAELFVLPAGPNRAADAGTAVGGDLELRNALFLNHQRSAPRSLPGGGIEVDAWLPTEQLSEIIQRVAGRYLPQVDKSRLVLDLAAGPAISTTGRYVPDGRERVNRPGWRQCTPEQIEQAQAAATLDLCQQLMARIGEFHLPGKETVRSLWLSHPQLREAVAQRVQALPRNPPVLETPGLCIISLSVRRAELLALLRNASQQIAGLPQKEWALLSDPRPGPDPLVISGHGLPPPDELPVLRRAAAGDADRPAWADEIKSARAAGRPPAGANPQGGQEIAVKAARTEAKRQLWLEIEKLPLEGGTVGDWIARTPQAGRVAAEIDALIFPMSAPQTNPDGEVTVALGIRLEPVWQIIQNNQ
jgi:hypothetical protein